MYLLALVIGASHAGTLPTECPIIVTGAEVAAYRADLVVPAILGGAASLGTLRADHGSDGCPSADGAACTGPTGVAFDGTLTESWDYDGWWERECDNHRTASSVHAVDFGASALDGGAAVAASGDYDAVESAYECFRYEESVESWDGALAATGAWAGLADDAVSGTADKRIEIPSSAGGVGTTYAWSGRIGACDYTSEVTTDNTGNFWSSGTVVIDGVTVAWESLWSCAPMYGRTTIDGVPAGNAAWATPAGWTDVWPDATTIPWEDADGDGWATWADCDDADPTIEHSPDCDGDGVQGGCDGADCDDHNRFVGEECDADGDGYVLGDCDTADPTRYPGAPDVCADGIDHDCDGRDGGDCDGDGFAGEDCDDDDATVFPGAADACGDGADDDCDGRDGGDCDGDGFAGDDCDDADATAFPGAADPRCDGVDQDCDGVDLTRDCDEDSFTFGDCDDFDAAVNEDADEVCGDGIDQDCDGEDAACPTAGSGGGGGGGGEGGAGCDSSGSGPHALFLAALLLVRARRASTR